MRQQFPAWYWTLALAGWLVFAAAPFVNDLIATESRSSIMGVILALGIVTAVWGFWVCPILDARNPYPRWTYEPRERMRNMRLMFFAPAMITFVCWLVSCVSIFERLQAQVDSPMGHLYVLWAVLLLTLLPLGWAGLVLSRICRRQLTDSCFKRHLCFNCGYDLAGNPHAHHCCECGAVIPQHVRSTFRQRARETLKYRDLVHELESRGIRTRRLASTSTTSPRRTRPRSTVEPVRLSELTYCTDARNQDQAELLAASA